MTFSGFERNFRHTGIENGPDPFLGAAA